MEELTNVCQAYTGEKCHAGEIPEKVQKRIWQKFDIPEDEQLIAFFDHTIFGYGKDGFVVATKGLYWKELWIKTFIPWSRVARLGDICIHNKTLRLDEGLEFTMQGCPLPANELINLLTQLRDTVVNIAESIGGAGAGEHRGDGNGGEDGHGSAETERLDQALQRVCEPYIGNNRYVGTIPGKLLEKVRSNFQIAEGLTVLAYFDFTIFGKGREGVVITEEGMYSRYLSKTVFISWLRLGPSYLLNIEKNVLNLGSGETLSLTGSPLEPDQWVQMLKEINELPHIIAIRQAAAASDRMAEDETVSLAETLKRMLQQYDGDKIHTRKIPDDIYERIQKAFRIPVNLSVLAYFDFTFFGSGKEGVLFTEIGLYWKVMSHFAFIPWGRLLRAEISYVPEKDALFLNSHTGLSLIGSPIPKGEWLILLTKIQALPQLAVMRHLIADDYPDESFPLLDEEFVELVCRSHSFFDKLTDYLPDPDKQVIIRHSFGIPESEPLVAFQDAGSGSAGEYGLLLTGRALCIKNKPGTCAFGKAVLPLAALDEVNLDLRKNAIYLEEEELYRSGAAPSLFALLYDLQLYAESLKAADNPVEYPYDPDYAVRWNLPVQNTDGIRWIVAEGGMLRGIYGAMQLRWAAETGQLHPENIRFWRRGLPRWIDAQEADLMMDHSMREDNQIDG